jgi:citrate synthase
MRRIEDIDREHQQFVELAELGVDGALERANELHDEAAEVWAHDEELFRRDEDFRSRFGDRLDPEPGVKVVFTSPATMDERIDKAARYRYDPDLRTTVKVSPQRF